MHLSLRKQPFALRLGLATALSVLGCLSYAGASNAATPTPPTGGGINCVAAAYGSSTEGKIDGRGSTLQNVLQQSVWGPDFSNDVCGPTPTPSVNTAIDNSGNTMVAYNYPSAVSKSLTGSGAGVDGAECRTDAFWGTDVPYTSAQYATLQAGGETTSTCSGSGAFNLSGNLVTPFTPSGTFPASTDTVTPIPVMSFPVAGAAVVLVTDLTAAQCGGTSPGTLNFTGAQVSALMGGDVATWNQLAPGGTYGVAGEDAGLANCTEAVTRIVRFDNSGTTNIFKNFLVKTDNTRTAFGSEPCYGSGTIPNTGSPGTAAGSGDPQHWDYYNALYASSEQGFSGNTDWPGLYTGGTKTAGADGTCSAIETPGTSGGPAVYKLVGSTPGAVSYLDLADFKNTSENSAPCGTCTVVAPNVQNGAATGYVPPSSGKLANCNFSSATLPSGSPVGLNSTDTWANDNYIVNSTSGSVDHNNLTDAGAQYPICGVTWQLVYTDLQGAAGTGPVSTLTNDQRQTLYSYVTYELGSTAQAYLGSNYYAPLPATWTPALLSGFQDNF
jgi:ABC-type phosphate transport system substrate-binding protein